MSAFTQKVAGRRVSFTIGNLTDVEEWALHQIRELFTDPSRIADLARWLTGVADLWINQDTGRIELTSARSNRDLERDAFLHRLESPVNRN